MIDYADLTQDLKPDELLMISIGEYNEYHVISIVRCLKLVNLMEEFRAWNAVAQENNRAYRSHIDKGLPPETAPPFLFSESFIDEMVREGFLVELNVNELNLDDLP